MPRRVFVVLNGSRPAESRRRRLDAPRKRGVRIERDAKLKACADIGETTGVESPYALCPRLDGPG
jgi:hypothetical protein